MADDVASVVNGRRATEARPLLHVVSGPNLGAEVPLADGAWTIGTGAAADLTFAEPTLADAHIRIVVAGGKCRISAMTDGVHLGGEALTVGAERDLPALRAVTVGGTAFAIGPAGSDWSAIEVVAPAAASSPPPQDDVSPVVEETIQPEPETRIDAEARMPTSPPRRSRLLLLVGVAGLLVLAGVVAFVLLSGNKPAPTSVAGPDPLARADEVIKELRLADVTTSMVKGRVVVAGYVATNDEIATLGDALRSKGVDADVQVRSEAALVEMATTVLKAYGVDAVAKADGPGRIVLLGYSDNAGRLDDVVRRLQTDVAGLREVTDRIVSLDRARASLVQAIAAAGLGDVIKVTVAQRTIKVVGFLDRARLSRWSGIEEAFRRDFGNHVSLDTQFVTLSAAAPRGVHLGKDPFIILTDGSRLSIGDMLGVTGKIIAIQADKIRVRTVSGDVDLPYAQTPNWIMEDR